eukprot:CAMPEP_0198312366 /NCGR_PEP_ID=MMETSP1450-20131203/3752_1 /TAXON_ID=753684 ORGANISM="Madagascaria erythrocladiodes, Strain CCMP3234" /NCGR_SAMPLE_ID=MMETSP1450 /ASSEMBLY_ACC=CAM_ASM_001115 /LENGTH=103 /DNA_ID=CAMNT_0044015311 /DNA_START=306 /DNA_END=613 /DNA_ORIENTATION=-
MRRFLPPRHLRPITCVLRLKISVLMQIPIETELASLRANGRVEEQQLLDEAHLESGAGTRHSAADDREAALPRGEGVARCVWAEVVDAGDDGAASVGRKGGVG